MADLTLIDAQKSFRNDVRAFAKQHLSSARETYTAHAGQWQDKFWSTQPIYKAAVDAGLLKAQVPAPLGGTSNGFVDMALMVEELYSVDTSASLTILGTGLGLTPLIMGGSPELQKKFLGPFLSGQGTPLASLVFSEPWGSANFADDAGEGFRTTAVLDGDSYIVNGEKIWATNSSGWDDRGADLQTLVCRIPSASSSNRTSIAILLLTRDDIATNSPSAYTVLHHPPTLGHTAVNGPHLRFTNLRIPASQLLAAPDGTGAALVEATFTGSGALVGAMGVGMQRQAFKAALHFAKTQTRGSGALLIEKQSVADLLVSMKTRLEAGRALTRRAAAAFESGAKLGPELCFEAKMVGSEGAVDGVREAIALVGVSAYRRDVRWEGVCLAGLWEDVIVLPVFDGGNVGVRRRQVEGLIRGEGYDGLED